MLYAKSFLSFFVFSLCALFLQSCNKNPVVHTPEAIRVEGKLVDVYGTPMFYTLVKVNDRYIRTGTEGKFVFEDVEPPYDVAVIDSALAETYLFKNITTPNPYLLLYNSSVPAVNAQINISFPQGSSLYTKAIFTNFNDINTYNFISSTNPQLKVRLQHYDNVTGSVILLRFVKTNGKIADYKQFGIKNNIQLKPYNTYEVNFTAADLSFNPEEETVTGNASSPQAPDYTTTFSFLSFSEYQFPDYAGILAYEDDPAQNFSFVFPSNLPISYKKVICAYSNVIADKSIFTTIGNTPGSININGPDAPSLISPENNAYDVNENTMLKFSALQDSCIFVIRIGNSNIYTTKTELSLGEFARLGLDFNFSQTVTWNVSCLGKYSSMDDFVSKQYLEKYSTPSETRTLTIIGN